ncbi:MAG: flagellar basal body-associated FliL family protein [Chloroflexota bacterium]
MRIPRASIYGAGVGLGIALIAGVSFYLGAATAPRQANAEVGQSKQAITAPGPMYTWKERVVNLADSGSRRYLKAAISIEFIDTELEMQRASAEERQQKQEEFNKQLAHQEPLIDDAIIALLSSKTTSDIASPEGKAVLKQEIRESLNNILGGERVVNVYFTQFVIQ